MRKERKEIGLGFLHRNEGQLVWLPKNPRQWTQTDIDRTAESIKRDTDFLEDRPLLVVALDKRDYIVFAGNLRYTGAVAAKLSKAPAVVYTPEGEEDEETIRRRALLDNGSFGSWDWDEVFSGPFGQMDLEALGIGKAFRDADGNNPSDMHLTTEGQEGGEGYSEFVEKFEQKLTTDDCYTPPAVYDAVLEFVGTITPTKGRKIVRPFFPGGDYEDTTQYPKGCLVVDNPPFSILSEILRFYCANGIKFFLFAPSLTLFTAPDCDLTYIVSNSDIIYENGARVRTGFITNLVPDLRVWCCPELARKIEEAQESEDKTKNGFVYPDNIVTAAILMKLVRRDVELKITKKSCEYINDCDSAKEQGRSLFGGGFIMSDRAAAERAAATRLNLSPREKEIIERLNEKDKDE